MSNIQNVNQQVGRAAQAGGITTVRYGVHNQPGAYVGRTIADIRRELAPMWNIQDDVAAFNGKVELTADHVVQPGETIEFMRKMGEKG